MPMTETPKPGGRVDCIVNDHPQIHAVIGWRITCTVCDRIGGRRAARSPLFATQERMWATMLGPDGHGWTRRDDGRILCRHHSAVAGCDLDGHQIDEWSTHPLDDELQWRYCKRCGGEFTQRIPRGG